MPTTGVFGTWMEGKIGKFVAEQCHLTSRHLPVESFRGNDSKNGASSA